MASDIHTRSTATMELRMKRVDVSGQQMAALVRGHDWSSTSLGPTETWPEALKLLLSIMMGSHQPMFVVWGVDHRIIYNDSYAEILASKHPEALGMPFFDVWHEIRADLEPIVAQAMSGESIFMDDIALLLDRKGFLEETHFSFSYTPVRDSDGRIIGIFCPCVETTGFVMSQRRLVERERELSVALSIQESLLDEKDVLLAEVNHRVKNSLQLVVSALSLQSRRIKDPVTKAAFEQAISRVRAITSVHERLYKSDNPLVVEMKTYLEGLAEDLAVTPETRHRMRVEVDDLTMRTERAIPLAIIVNELVTNCLKYAYPMDRPGPIVLSLLKRTDGMLELMVADEGVGMLNKEESGGGLGTRLVATMASQLGAAVDRSATEEGFKVSLVFSCEEPA
ncbi:sensor histidine kinase [Aureimonas sp. AU12]|uniref:sensor histidine kinase n=1 Tax=Aureimonas sp. AU12 TaxID=1638161 RepID=UPI000783517E|nr:histidine kinase dimerization/phosphoacceptor domain -containing protein [Aureimonas sp. AU12]